ncbi:hypothetical protein X943_001249 [Babesia divergens]|uniref:Uncharacterized protein n=1 Tax=Babesia divergens TaxID=32595 RepID=A0AAD9LHX0_BABDI|nr:hypothetical protein X943_001249 [Babesia divergens]
MGSEDMNTLQGGDWHDYACNGNDYGHRSGSKVDLHLWLTDVKGSGTGLVKRGFTHSDKHSFTNKKGSDVATAIANIISHESPAALQNVLCGFMFGSEDLLKEPYKDHSGAFKDVCKGLQSSLQPFIFGSSYLFAVCKSNTTLFDGIWDDKNFDKYCDWLRKNLKNIIEALKAMSSDCKQWTKKNLQSASSAGPSRFGFVFKDDSWEGKINSELPSKISPLTDSAAHSGSLEKLEKALEPSSSSAATAAGAAGGIFGLGGAGAGVAYGLNLFGFKNLVTGLISGFLK